MYLGFDQEAATVLISRYAVYRAASGEEILDILRWLDRMLIKLVGRFANYKKEDPNSFKLSKEFHLYPQFMYHLRRSQFLQTFNESPDESAYFRSLLMRETIANSLVMIQPALLEYSFQHPEPVPVMLEMSSLKVDVVLLLDTFFHVIIWHGDKVNAWKLEGYQDLPEYENFKQILTAPVEDAEVFLFFYFYYCK